MNYAKYIEHPKPKDKAEQRERLERVLEDIKYNPQHHRQETWHCGTSHCFAGIAQLHARGLPLSTVVGYHYMGRIDRIESKCSPSNCDLFFEHHGEYCHFTENEAQTWLGLGDDDVNVLFDSENTLEMLEGIVRTILDEEGEES